ALVRTGSHTAYGDSLFRRSGEITYGKSEDHDSTEWSLPRGRSGWFDRTVRSPGQQARSYRETSLLAVPLRRVRQQAVLRRDAQQDWIPSGRNSGQEGAA